MSDFACPSRHPESGTPCYVTSKHLDHSANVGGVWVYWEDPAPETAPPSPRSRSTDPSTSKAAGDSVDVSLTPRVLAAVDVIRDAGTPLTQHEIGCRLAERGVVPDPEIGRRAARTAAEEFGLLVRTGQRATNRTGSRAYTYDIAREAS